MPDSTDARLIYITTDGPEEAKRIGRALVEARLAACVNILDPMISMYWWNGEVTDGRETVLIAKTTQARIKALTAKVRELHSYSCPCVVALPLTGGNTAFIEWIATETESVERK